MNENFNIVLFIQSDVIPANVQGVLQKEGHSVQTADNIRDAARLIKKLENPLFIADVGDSADFSYEAVKKIIANKVIKSHPLIVIGKDVDSFENIFDKHCKFSLTLNSPIKSKEIVEGIEYIKLNYKPVPQLPKSQPKRTSSLKVSDPKLAIKNTIIKELDSQIDSIPEILFNQLKNLDLIERQVGGNNYAFKIDASFAADNALIPTDDTIKKAIDQLFEDCGKWGKLHLMRIAYIARQIGTALSLSADTMDLLAAASYLHAWTFAGDEPELLKKDYIRADTSLTRKALCSKIKDSAMRIATDLANPKLSGLVATVGKYIGEESPVGDDELSLAACAIMTADMCDRICYHSGHWNSRSAYHLMKRLKAGFFQDIHPKVWACIVKFLSEAVVAKQSAWLLPKSVREDPDLIEKARSLNEDPVSDHEEKIPLAVLKPGMRLSRPLFAFDGKEILPDDLTLDDDLIWRIWQLSAVRPLNAPVVIKNKDEVSEAVQ
ncbi:MAG: hypothetical protein R3A13_05780 [Bdellovibrionota bacterium]